MFAHPTCGVSNEMEAAAAAGVRMDAMLTSFGRLSGLVWRPFAAALGVVRPTNAMCVGRSGASCGGGVGGHVSDTAQPPPPASSAMVGVVDAVVVGVGVVVVNSVVDDRSIDCGCGCDDDDDDNGVLAADDDVVVGVCTMFGTLAKRLRDAAVAASSNGVAGMAEAVECVVVVAVVGSSFFVASSSLCALMMMVVLQSICICIRPSSSSTAVCIGSMAAAAAAAESSAVVASIACVRACVSVRGGEFVVFTCAHVAVAVAASEWMADGGGWNTKSKLQ